MLLPPLSVASAAAASPSNAVVGTTSPDRLPAARLPHPKRYLAIQKFFFSDELGSQLEAQARASSALAVSDGDLVGPGVGSSSPFAPARQALQS